MMFLASAIILVVVGHLVAREMPGDNSWFAILKYCIYRFHMPLFMVLTGMTFAMSLPRFGGIDDVQRFARKRVSRLLVPYMTMGVLVLIGKFLVAPYMHVDNMPTDFGASLLHLITAPAQSAAQFIWFIYIRHKHI